MAYNLLTNAACMDLEQQHATKRLMALNSFERVSLYSGETDCAILFNKDVVELAEQKNLSKEILNS